MSREEIDQHTAYARYNAALEAERFNLVAMLRPRVFLDGNKWCVLYGENLMDGVCGFGETPELAVTDFNSAWSRRPVTLATQEPNHG